jgi:hypothetical protein
MSTSVEQSLEAINSEHLFDWVRAGLLRFEQNNLTKKTAEISQYEDHLAQALNGHTDLRWQDINQLLLASLKISHSGAAVLVKPSDTDLSEFFLYILCSAIEMERDIIIRIASIQNNNQVDWLQVGFAQGIIQFLFELPVAPDLTAFRLVKEELLIIKGQGPLFGRNIYTSVDYWKAINEGKLLSEFVALGDDGIILEDQTMALSAELLRRNNLLAVDTDQKTAEAITHGVSRYTGLTPVQVDYDDWVQTSLRALMRYAKWLPLISCEKSDSSLLKVFNEFTPGILLVRSDQQLPENCIKIELPLAEPAQRKKWWEQLISDPQALTILASSMLSQAAVRRIGLQLMRPQDDDILQQIRKIRSVEGTAHLRKVAMPVDTWVTQPMLIFPHDTQLALQQCFERTLQRDYQHLGMGDSIRATANAGVMLLFSGASGTGKTLASSWIASRLGAPLFKIDLAMIMNKYVGETEKNLAVALDEAAKTDVILLFDEADALFGKRSDSSSGGDRYANMLTNYLLSRIETHPGIVILTTNAGSRMDSAFQRRIDISVDFQALPYAERIKLWESMLATRNPGRSLCQRIARYCELPPGHVRNVVINACCWHPHQKPLSAYAIWQGLEEEYRKIGRSMPSQLMALKETRSKSKHDEENNHA